MRTNFVRSVMAGLLTGIIAAAANFLYAFFYKLATGTSTGFAGISTISIFIGLPLLLLLAGILFFSITRYLKKGGIWFSILILLMTAFAIITSLFAPGEVTLSGNKGLVFGMEVITGIITLLLLPWLARYFRLFMEQRMRYRR